MKQSSMHFQSLKNWQKDIFQKTVLATRKQKIYKMIKEK